MVIIIVVSFNSTQLKQQTAHELPEIATSKAILGHGRGVRVSVQLST